jgi:hypothetical protein
MMIQLLVWNARGVGNEPTLSRMHTLCVRHKVKILVILEPKVQFDKQHFCRRLGFVEASANCNNHIWCLSKDEFSQVVVHDYVQFLHLHISSCYWSGPLDFTFIYAKNRREERQDLWEGLSMIAEDIEESLWLIAGDFNTPYTLPMCFMAGPTGLMI